MQWLDQWRALAARVDGFIRAAEVFGQFSHGGRHDARSRVESAFEHLRRLLAVDSTVRERWDAAFQSGETHCEKLGAVHLLAHGIWAFKVSGSGAATDLVMNEPLQNELPLVERTGNAIVLTEWKVVRDVRGLERKAAEARAQAKLYA